MQVFIVYFGVSVIGVRSILFPRGKDNTFFAFYKKGTNTWGKPLRRVLNDVDETIRELSVRGGGRGLCGAQNVGAILVIARIT